MLDLEVEENLCRLFTTADVYFRVTFLCTNPHSVFPIHDRVHKTLVVLQVIVQFQHSAVPDEWGTPQDGQARPRVVKRGIDDHDDIPDGNSGLLFSVSLVQHGTSILGAPPSSLNLRRWG